VTGRPRVWPVFVAFALAFVALQTVSAVVLGAWAWATMAPVGGTNAFVARLSDLAASPPGLTVAALISATGLGLAALLGAAASPEPWRLRLRLTTAGLGAGRIALVVVGVLAVSQALDSCVVLLGLSRFGALDHINRVLARASGSWLAVLTVALALGPGVAEEMFFRGYMQKRLVERFGSAIAIGVTAACFGFIHFDLVHTPVAAGLGVFLGWSVERTGTIVPAIAAHVVNNLIAVLTARWPMPSAPAAQVALLAASLIVVAGVVFTLSRVTAPSQERAVPSSDVS
jgi:membrane protease YdiL (CAAX protease family)